MDNPVEEVKKRIDIVEFIGSFITLKKAGRNFKAVCPFHQEKTPSFVISPDRQIWHCFGACQEGGDIIRFLMKWDNITFFEALKELAEKAGVQLKSVRYEDSVWKKKERYISMNTYAGEFFQYILQKTKFGNKALSYLENREISEKTQQAFQLGYAPQSWDSLTKFLSRKKFSEQEMHDNGLLVRNERGRLYDRFRGRLMFPIKDTRGNIVAFSGRILEGEDMAKYVNTPETPIYHKRETLFGIHLAKDAIKKAQNAYIVEGEFDMISPYQHGFSNFVAIKGSALTREQLMLLKRYTNKITLALDADAAGEEAIKRGIEEAERMEFDIGVVIFDDAKDPDEAVRKNAEAFKKAVSKPLPIYDYLLENAQKKYPDDDPFSKRKIGEEILPFVERIRNSIVQSHYIKKLARVLDVSESSIESMIRKIRFQKKQKQSFKAGKKELKPIEHTVLIQKYLLSVILQNENPLSTASEVGPILRDSDFSLPSLQKIYGLLQEMANDTQSGQFSLAGFTQQLSEQLQPVFDEVYLFASTDLGIDRENIKKMAYDIRKYSIKRKIGELLSSETDQQQTSKEELSLLNSQLKEVEKKLITL